MPKCISTRPCTVHSGFVIRYSFVLGYFVIRRFLERILVDIPVLHDDPDGRDVLAPRLRIEPFAVGTKDGEVLKRVAVNDQDVGVGALFDHAQFAIGIRVFLSGAIPMIPFIGAQKPLPATGTA